MLLLYVSVLSYGSFWSVDTFPIHDFLFCCLVMNNFQFPRQVFKVSLSCRVQSRRVERHAISKCDEPWAYNAGLVSVVTLLGGCNCITAVINPLTRTLSTSTSSADGSSLASLFLLNVCQCYSLSLCMFVNSFACNISLLSLIFH